MSQVAIAIRTIRPNRIVYADGSWNDRFFSVGAVVVGSAMRLSCGYGRNRGGHRVVLPGPLCARHLEADEAVHDVQKRTEKVEEAVREVGSGRDSEHTRDVGAAGVPRHQDGGDRAGVLYRPGQHLRCQTAAGELPAEHPRREDVRDVLVAGDHVEAYAAAVDRG